MGLAGIDHGFELRVRQYALGDETFGQAWTIAWLGRCDRRHGRRLHELGRMGLRAGNADRLKSVFLVDGVGQPTALGRLPVKGLIGEVQVNRFLE